MPKSPLMLSSITSSQGSISNFIAQTPKQAAQDPFSSTSATFKGVFLKVSPGPQPYNQTLPCNKMPVQQQQSPINYCNTKAKFQNNRPSTRSSQTRSQPKQRLSFTNNNGRVLPVNYDQNHYNQNCAPQRRPQHKNHNKIRLTDCDNEFNNKENQANYSNIIIRQPQTTTAVSQSQSGLGSRLGLQQLIDNNNNIHDDQGYYYPQPKFFKKCNRQPQPQQNKKALIVERSQSYSQSRASSLSPKAISNMPNNFTKLLPHPQLPYKMINSELPSNCVNHPEKPSTYYVIQEEDGHNSSNSNATNNMMLYCEKCAILVASQGFQVHRIEDIEEENHPVSGSVCNSSSRLGSRSNYMQGETSQSFVKYNEENDQHSRPRYSLRQTNRPTIKKEQVNEDLQRIIKENELNDFLNLLERTENRLGLVQKENINTLNSVNQHFQNSAMDAMKAFKSLREIIDKREREFQQSLQDKRALRAAKCQHTLKQLTENLSSLANMKDDICQSYDDVINMTTFDQFKTVMEVYNANIKAIQETHPQRSNSATDCEERSSLPLNKKSIQAGGFRKNFNVEANEGKDKSNVNANANSNDNGQVVQNNLNQNQFAFVTNQSLTSLLEELSNELTRNKRQSLLNQRRTKRKSSVLRERLTMQQKPKSGRIL